MMKNLFFVVLLLFATTLSAQIAEQPAGVGTPENPYQIANFNNLLWIGQSPGYWSLHYLQTANIDASASTQLDLGAGWTPLGMVSPWFTGTYDGQGFEIQGLYLSRTVSNYTGLFGYLVGAKLNNIHLRGLSIGGFIYAGGLAGVAQSSMINNCSTTGVVTGNNNVGGLVGFANYHTVFTNCFSQVSVQGSDNVGGLVGQSGFDYAHYYNCYSNGAVNGGANFYQEGLIGRHNGGDIKYCYWDYQTSGQSTNRAGFPKTTAQMKQQSTYETWNFDTGWSILEGVSYPNLSLLATWDLPTTITLAELTGTGTEADPYLIGNANQLQSLSLAPQSWFMLTDDIDLSSSVIWNHGQGWLPVGTAATPFSGTLDGDGHSIQNLVINRPRNDYNGIYAYTQNATLKNIKILSAKVWGKVYCSVLVADAFGGEINDVDISCQMISSNNAGAICARMVNSTVNRCHADVSIPSAGDSVGGLVGILSSSGTITGTISQSTSRGNIVAGWNVGGITGFLSWGYITNCYSRASVYGGRNVGGVAGIVGGSNNAFINNSYATGWIGITPGGSFYGGVAGYVSDGSLTNLCYYDTDSTGIPNDYLNQGRTHTQMIYPGSLDTFSAWDFVNIWRHDQQSAINSGYPHLGWQDLPLPDSVSGLLISFSGNQINLEWQPVADITAYHIYSADDPYLPWNEWTYVGESAQNSYSLPGDSKKFFIVKAARN